MKGYFSQLAQSSGLNFESGKSSAERSGPFQSTRMTAPKPAPSPIHVEEFVVSEPVRTTAPDVTRNVTPTNSIETSSARFSPAADKTNQEYVRSTTERTVEQVEPFTWIDDSRIPAPAGDHISDSLDQLPGLKSRDNLMSTTEELRIQYAGMEPAPEPSRFVREPASQTEPGSARLREVEQTAELLREVSWKPKEVEPQSVALDQLERGTEARTLEPPEAPVKPSDSEWPTLQDYLSEIRAWMTSDSESTAEIDQRQALEPGSKHPSEQSTRTRDISTSSPLSAKPQPPEQQDLSLSIGTISIVIEEPNRAVAAAPQPVAPPVANMTQETAKEPTSLSRYYLRTW
jgi:hypothetical protein